MSIHGKTIWGIILYLDILLRKSSEGAHLTNRLPGSTLDPTEVRHGPTPKAPEKRADRSDQILLQDHPVELDPPEVDDPVVHIIIWVQAGP